MANDKAGLSYYDRMFEICLLATRRDDQRVSEWGGNAKVMAEELCAIGGQSAAPGLPGAALVPGAVAGLPGVPGAPAVPVTVPQGVGVSRFGPAFNGWDDTAMQHILFAAQQYVVGTEMGASEEQTEAVKADLWQGVEELRLAHAAARPAAAPG